MKFVEQDDPDSNANAFVGGCESTTAADRLRAFDERRAMRDHEVLRRMREEGSHYCEIETEDDREEELQLAEAAGDTARARRLRESLELSKKYERAQSTPEWKELERAQAQHSELVMVELERAYEADERIDVWEASARVARSAEDPMHAWVREYGSTETGKLLRETSSFKHYFLSADRMAQEQTEDDSDATRARAAMAVVRRVMRSVWRTAPPPPRVATIYALAPHRDHDAAIGCAHARRAA